MTLYPRPLPTSINYVCNCVPDFCELEKLENKFYFGRKRKKHLHYDHVIILILTVVEKLKYATHPD